jgi:hypothetical protein
VCLIVPRLLDLDKGPTYEPNATLKLGNLWTKLNLFFYCKPLNLIAQNFINARCNKNYIIAHITFALVPHKCIKHDNIVMFHIQDKLEQLLLWGQFGWLPTYNVGVTSGLNMDLMVGITKVANFLNSCKVKFVRVLNKLEVVCIVANTFQTPMVWSIDCLAPDLNSFELNK